MGIDQIVDEFNEEFEEEEKALDIREIIENAWLGLDNLKSLNLTSPLIDIPEDFKSNPTLHYLDFFRNPAYFEATCFHFLNVHLPQYQAVILETIWTHTYPMLISTRGGAKSFILAVYAILRAFLKQGEIIIFAGAGFRQSKFLFDYCVKIWNNAPLLRDACKYHPDQGPKTETDKVSLRIGDSLIIGIPIGMGDKIRGYRANVLIIDETSSHSEEILEKVLFGFTSTELNPMDNVKYLAKREKLQELGMWTAEDDVQHGLRTSNQTIMSGTCSYSFNHFYRYWKKYRDIIYTRGDERKLQEILRGEIQEGFNWKDYCIIRLPWNLLPKGMLNDKQIGRAKATMNTSMFHLEHCAVFSRDSDGFFKRSSLEACTTKNPIELPSGPVKFNHMLRGVPGRSYIFGVDPVTGSLTGDSSKTDNFAVTVLEVWPDHNRVVYVWTTNRQRFNEARKKKYTELNDFYGFCARKIRQLTTIFPCDAIGIDSQGGGGAIMEALHDKDKLMGNEMPMWPIIIKDKPHDYDRMPGPHIIEIINFASAQWVSEANHGMKKDLEDKILLFPYYDAISIGLAIEEDKRLGRDYDTLEDCVIEIEELKDELTTIVHSQSVSGRERWDTPEIKLPGAKKGYQRKDRYSSLLIANAIARQKQRKLIRPPYEAIGGWAGNIEEEEDNYGIDYSGPKWFTDGIRGVY